MQPSIAANTGPIPVLGYWKTSSTSAFFSSSSSIDMIKLTVCSAVLRKQPPSHLRRKRKPDDLGKQLLGDFQRLGALPCWITTRFRISWLWTGVQSFAQSSPCRICGRQLWTGFEFSPICKFANLQICKNRKLGRLRLAGSNWTATAGNTSLNKKPLWPTQRISLCTVYPCVQLAVHCHMHLAG